MGINPRMRNFKLSSEKNLPRFGLRRFLVFSSKQSTSDSILPQKLFFASLWKDYFLFASLVGLLRSTIVVIVLIHRKQQKQQFVSKLWRIYPCELLPKADSIKLWFIFTSLFFSCENGALMWSSVVKYVWQSRFNLSYNKSPEWRNYYHGSTSSVLLN